MQAQKNEILHKMHEKKEKRRRQLCVAQRVWAEKNKVSKSTDDAGRSSEAFT